MVFRRLDMLELALCAMHTWPGDLDVPVLRHGPDVRPAVGEHARNLSVSGVHVDDVLEDIRRDDHVERAVIERRSLNILAPISPDDSARWNVGPVVGADVLRGFPP